MGRVQTSRLVKPSTSSGSRYRRTATHSVLSMFGRAGRRHDALSSSGFGASGFHGRSIASVSFPILVCGLNRTDSRACDGRGVAGSAGVPNASCFDIVIPRVRCPRCGAGIPRQRSARFSLGPHLSGTGCPWNRSHCIRCNWLSSTADNRLICQPDHCIVHRMHPRRGLIPVTWASDLVQRFTSSVAW